MYAIRSYYEDGTEFHRSVQRVKEGIVAAFLPEFGQKINAAGLVTRIGPFVFLKPAFFGMLPTQRQFYPVFSPKPEAVLPAQLENVVKGQSRQGLMIAQASRFVVPQQVIASPVITSYSIHYTKLYDDQPAAAQYPMGAAW